MIYDYSQGMRKLRHRRCFLHSLRPGLVFSLICLCFCYRILRFFHRIRNSNTLLQQRILHIPTNRKMFIHSGLRLCRRIIDFDTCPQWYIQEFRNFFYGIGIANLDIIFLTNMIKFILSAAIDICRSGQTDLPAIDVHRQGISHLRKTSQFHDRRHTFRGWRYHNVIPIMYLRIHIRFFVIDADDCCLSLFPPYHAALTVYGK